MEYKLVFKAIGELKKVNIYTTSKSPYTFIIVKSGYQGKTSIGISIFGNSVDLIKNSDEGRPISVSGVIKNYKKKDGTYDKSFIAKDIEFLDEDIQNEKEIPLNETSKNNHASILLEYEDDGSLPPWYLD